MSASNYTPIPEGYKRCCRGELCAHPNGPILPATSEYFVSNKSSKDGLHYRCKVCHSFLNASYRSRNKEKLRESNRRYREQYPDRVRESRYKWRTSHPEAQRAIDLRYSHNNKERIRQRHRAQYSKHIENHRRYRREHAAERRHSTNLYRAKKRQLKATFNDADWNFALEYFHSCCAYCGKQRGLWQTKLAQDHYIPLSKGGSFTPDNVVPACNGKDGCNQMKSGAEPHQWLIERFGKTKAKKIEEHIQAFFAVVRKTDE